MNACARGGAVLDISRLMNIVVGLVAVVLASLARVALASTSCSSSTPINDTEAPILTLHGVLAEPEIDSLLAAEYAAWSDEFLTQHSLVNHTRRLPGSSVLQSVTWLHRHRAHAHGAFERVEAAVLAAAEGAGWMPAELLRRPLHVRCMESIRYEVVAGDVRGGP